MNANYIQQLFIKTYRGIQNLSLDELGVVNILVGDNNSGKTSLLEVLRSITHPTSYQTWRRIANRSQGLMLPIDTPFESFSWLSNINHPFPEIGYDITLHGMQHNVLIQGRIENVDFSVSDAKSAGISLIAETVHDYLNSEDAPLPDAQEMNLKFFLDGREQNSVSLFNFARSPQESDPDRESLNLFEGPVNYLSPVQHANARPFMSKVFDSPELYESMLEVLQEFEPGIISINADHNDPYSRKLTYKILSRNNAAALPLKYYGDGINKALLMMSAVVASKNGILLIDEFETAIHTTAMPKTYEWLLSACQKLNVQLFLTTHSMEAVDKLLEASEIPEELKVIRLKKKHGKTYARTMSGTEAIQNRKEYDMELRI